MLSFIYACDKFRKIGQYAIFMLNVIIPNVVMLSVLSPFLWPSYKYKFKLRLMCVSVCVCVRERESVCV
jgi:hypothetical protein